MRHKRLRLATKHSLVGTNASLTTHHRANNKLPLRNVAAETRSKNLERKPCGLCQEELQKFSLNKVIRVLEPFVCAALLKLFLLRNDAHKCILTYKQEW